MAGAERRAEQEIKVRRVTSVHGNRSAQGRGEPGTFSHQLILDDGAEEYAIRLLAQDADVLVNLFGQTDAVYFDTEREVLVFGDISG